MILFLDANVIIYQVEAVATFQDQVQASIDGFLQHHPAASFAVSRLSMLECLVKPLREQDTAAITRYREFFAASDLHVVEVTSQIIEAATWLRAHHGLRTPDAIQAASALSLKGPVVFFTGDRNFKSVPNLRVRFVE